MGGKYIGVVMDLTLEQLVRGHILKQPVMSEIFRTGRFRFIKKNEFSPYVQKVTFVRNLNGANVFFQYLELRYKSRAVRLLASASFGLRFESLS